MMIDKRSLELKLIKIMMLPKLSTFEISNSPKVSPRASELMRVPVS